MKCRNIPTGIVSVTEVIYSPQKIDVTILIKHDEENIMETKKKILSQLEERIFISDGGLETTLIREGPPN